MRIREILENPNSFCTSVNVACLKLFGTDYYSWDPLTLRKELEEYRIPSKNFDKINAISVLVSTDMFYRYFESFSAIIKVFNQFDANFNIQTPLTGIELIWGLREAKKNDDFDPFSKDVQGFVTQSLRYFGVPNIDKFLEGTGLSYNENIKDKEYEKEVENIIEVRENLLKKELE